MSLSSSFFASFCCLLSLRSRARLLPRRLRRRLDPRLVLIHLVGAPATCFLLRALCERRLGAIQLAASRCLQPRMALGVNRRCGHCRPRVANVTGFGGLDRGLRFTGGVSSSFFSSANGLVTFSSGSSATCLQEQRAAAAAVSSSGSSSSRWSPPALEHAFRSNSPRLRRRRPRPASSEKEGKSILPRAIGKTSTPHASTAIADQNGAPGKSPTFDSREGRPTYDRSAPPGSSYSSPDTPWSPCSSRIRRFRRVSLTCSTIRKGVPVNAL